MFSSKKGQDELGLSLSTLISLALIIEIFLGISAFLFALRSGSKFEEHFLTRDIATLIDTITISPNDLVVDYPKDTRKLAINIEKEKVSVYKPQKITSVVAYPFSEDKNLIYEYTELLPSEDTIVRPRFIKEENKISVIKKEFYIAGITKPVCIGPKESLKAKGGLVVEVIEPINDLSLLENPEFRAKAKSADIVVIIMHSDEFDEAINPINVYVHLDTVKSSEGMYLGCLIINKILENEKLSKLISEKELTGFTIHNRQLTNKVDINFGNIALLLEIGNKRIPKDRNLIEQEGFIELIKESIKIAIDAYG